MHKSVPNANVSNLANLYILSPTSLKLLFRFQKYTNTFKNE